jgi:hypothetical protein
MAYGLSRAPRPGQAISGGTLRTVVFSIQEALSMASVREQVIHTYMHLYMHAYMHSYGGFQYSGGSFHGISPRAGNAYIHAFIHAYMHSCNTTSLVSVREQVIHAYMHTCTHTFIHANTASLISVQEQVIHACMHVYNISTTPDHTFIHTYTCTYNSFMKSF